MAKDRSSFSSSTRRGRGLPSSYLEPAGQWVPATREPGGPQTVLDRAGDGGYPLYVGSLSVGTYALCLGYDAVAHGGFDLAAAVYACVAVTVQ